MKTSPNILLIMTDQHRGDCLGCAGNEVAHTPNIDSIARDGVLFRNAYSSTPTCTPARSALLTGLSPWHHGMLGYGRVARRYPVELPRALREAGYFTFGIGKMHWFPQKALHGFHATLVDESGRVETPGFVSDYRRWFKEQAPELDPDATGIGWNDYQSGVYVLPEELHPTYWTGMVATDFIESYDKPEPFFLKVSFARPHSPYDPPQRFWDMFSRDRMPPPFIGDWAGKYAPESRPGASDIWHGDKGLDQVRKSRHGYYGSVAFIDEQVGKIMSALKKRGMYENTLILFTSDHGDMLGDHHLWRKSYAYEGSACIPMILKWHDEFPSNQRRGTIREEPVELRDVLPTFLDAAGASIPSHLDGQSMLDIIRNGGRKWREFIDLEHDVCYSPENHWNALTDGRIKYIYHAFSGEEQLFDLIKDPGEEHDLSDKPEYRETLAEWRERLVAHLSERGARWVKDGRLQIRKERTLYSPLFPGHD